MRLFPSDGRTTAGTRAITWHRSSSFTGVSHDQGTLTFEMIPVVGQHDVRHLPVVLQFHQCFHPIVLRSISWPETILIGDAPSGLVVGFMLDYI